MIASEERERPTLAIESIFGELRHFSKGEYAFWTGPGLFEKAWINAVAIGDHIAAPDVATRADFLVGDFVPIEKINEGWL